jgi:hypothetical protein
MSIVHIGIDLAKNVFAVHGVTGCSLSVRTLAPRLDAMHQAR